MTNIALTKWKLCYLLYLQTFYKVIRTSPLAQRDPAGDQLSPFAEFGELKFTSLEGGNFEVNQVNPPLTGFGEPKAISIFIQNPSEKLPVVTSNNGNIAVDLRTPQIFEDFGSQNNFQTTFNSRPIIQRDILELPPLQLRPPGPRTLSADEQVQLPLENEVQFSPQQQSLVQNDDTFVVFAAEGGFEGQSFPQENNFVDSPPTEESGSRNKNLRSHFKIIQLSPTNSSEDINSASLTSNFQTIFLKSSSDFEDLDSGNLIDQTSFKSEIDFLNDNNLVASLQQGNINPVIITSPAFQPNKDSFNSALPAIFPPIADRLNSRLQATFTQNQNGFNPELPATFTQNQNGFNPELPATFTQNQNGFNPELPATFTQNQNSFDSNLANIFVPAQDNSKSGEFITNSLRNEITFSNEALLSSNIQNPLPLSLHRDDFVIPTSLQGNQVESSPPSSNQDNLNFQFTSRLNQQTPTATNLDKEPPPIPIILQPPFINGNSDFPESFQDQPRSRLFLLSPFDLRPVFDPINEQLIIETKKNALGEETPQISTASLQSRSKIDPGSSIVPISNFDIQAVNEIPLYPPNGIPPPIRSQESSRDFIRGLENRLQRVRDTQNERSLNLFQILGSPRESVGKIIEPIEAESREFVIEGRSFIGNGIVEEPEKGLFTPGELHGGFIPSAFFTKLLSVKS